MCNKGKWCGNNWYKIKIIVFSLTVLEKNPQRIKLCNTKSKFLGSLFLKLWEICWKNQKEEPMQFNKNICMKNCVTKVKHLKTRNRTVMLILPRYCTYLLMCCAIHSKVWWYGAKFTDNQLVARKDLWFITAHLVRWNNDSVMCFFILWCKNGMHLKKISNMMNLWI